MAPNVTPPPPFPIVILIPSVQLGPDDAPRFHVPLDADHPARALLEETERAGGVQAEVRAFLDAQLETGDAVLDLDPSVGFVALSAATAPQGAPAVFIAGLDPVAVQRLQDAAADAGGWVEDIDVREAGGLCATIDARLEPNGRVFVHMASANVPWAVASLEPLLSAGRILAVCISDAQADPQWAATAGRLMDRGLVPHELAERDGDAVLLPLEDAPAGAVIAVAVGLPDVTSAASSSTCMATPPAGRPTVASDRLHWEAARDGFAFIAPHSRTGYGVAAAHLLRALQQRAVPVSFFPIGPVDGTLVGNPLLQDAIARQMMYRADVPSVRLSQQFDLALHVGRGPKVGFTIFELDHFSSGELHHLRQQDLILSCSTWAQQVIHANGITEIPVRVVPLGVDRTVFHEHLAPAMKSSDTVFLQVGKLEVRKGQLALLRAFEAAFTPKDAVRLVLVCSNPFVSKAAFDAALSPFRQSPMASRITLITHELPSQREVAELMAGADCGVFPVRAEGWNLEALEMLSMGKTVIATDYSAHTEFLTAKNARLVSVDALESASEHRVGQWAAWGAAQHEQLVAHLRDVHALRREGALTRNEAGIATARHFSWEHAADALLQALQVVA